MCGRGAGASRRGTTWASIRCAKRRRRSRYDVWWDALVLTYTGDGCGIPMGASYVDVLRWLPQMRPYGGPADGEFRDMVFAITHLVYTLNDYNRYRLSPEWLPDEFEFLRENLKAPVA